VGKLIRFLTVIVLGSLVTSVSAVFLAPQVQSVLTANDAADISEVELTPLAQRSVMLAADGSLYAVLHGDQNRKSVPLEEMPRVLIDTVLAVEDEHFFEHEGVNLRATMRALLTNVSAGDVEQGGSTITQQLVKNSTDVGTAQTMDRKVKEAVLALRLEDQLTKREILERYLNTVYLGNTAYGVQAAAELYFGKDAKDLDQIESAFLAGVIQNPVNLDPYRRPDAVIRRRSEVVDRLLATNKIDEEEARFIEASPIPTERNELPSPEDPFLEEVRRQLLNDERLGPTREARADALYTGGLTIHTTIDPRLQAMATYAAVTGNPKPEELAVALASVEPSTGAVRAIAGEAVRDGRKIELLTGTGRQAGSSFKPFLLAAYLEEAGSPNDTISGSAPCTFPNPGGSPDPYRGTNYAESGGGGVMDLRRATTTSNNCAFLNLAQVVGLEKMRDVARNFGLPMEGPLTVSSPLGTADVNPVQQAAAYAAFANNGVFNPPYFIDQVVDREGQVVIAHEPAPRPVVSPETAAIVTDLLADNVTRGTGTRAQFPDRRPAAGKTGTAQEHQDAWFAGYIPQMSTAVWLGNPIRPIRMEPIGGRSVTGGGFPAPIWGGYMSAAFGDAPPVPFPEMPEVRPGTRAMNPLERLATAERQAEAREQARRDAAAAARRAAEQAARRPAPTAPPATQPPAPSPTTRPVPGPPERPDRNPPPLEPPGAAADDDD
jgi:penicillin-binding protein 1A